MSDLRERAQAFYDKQGYDFGPDNIDIVELLWSFAVVIRAEAKAEGWGDVSAAPDAATRAGCVQAAIRAFLDAVENSEQPISHNAMQTLRAHLRERA